MAHYTQSIVLSTGRRAKVIFGCLTEDGRSPTVSELFEILRYYRQELGEYLQSSEKVEREDRLKKTLLSVVKAKAKGFVTTAALVSRIRALNRDLTRRQIEKLLPAVMPLLFDHSRSNDLPGAKGAVRGYRGISLR